MSWVSDIVLLCGLAEKYPGAIKIGTPPIEPRAVAVINEWLQAGDWAPLSELNVVSEKAFQACIYGAALNRLDVSSFLRVVGEQQWEEPGAVLLLIKNEEETTFTVYRITNGRLQA